MQRAKIWKLLLCFLSGVYVARADSPAGIHSTTEITPPPAETVFPEYKEHKKCTDALARKIDVVHFDRVSLKDAFDLLQKQSGDIDVDWDGLAEQHIQKDTLVSLDLSATSLRETIRKLLASLNNKELRLCEGFYPPLISTRERLQVAKYQIVCVFDLRLLLPEASTPQDQYIEHLVSELRKQVAPDTWRDNGGTIGSARVLNHQLIINQTVDGMEDVRQFLLGLYQENVRYVRSYDVRDLVRDGQGRVDAVENAIKGKVEPNSWGPPDSAVNLMCEFDGWIYVTASKATHRKIEDCMAQIRKNGVNQ